MSYKYYTFIILLLVNHCTFSQQKNIGKNSSISNPPEGMILIPGGTFEMGIAEEDLKKLAEMGHKVPHMSENHAMWWFGDEIPKHTVEVKPFYLDIHEVTNRQFEQFVQDTGYHAQEDWQKYNTADRLDHPIVNVDWYDARSYAEWAGKRLPTEAEWEYAAKGGMDVKWFPWGDIPSSTQANYRHQGESFFAGLVRLAGLRRMGTKQVGSFPPNGFGLYDMIGNVSEWCEDTREPYPSGPTDEWLYSRYGPYKKAKPIYGKVVRGGSWESPNPVFIRLTNRSGSSPDSYSNCRGFRCAKSVLSH